MCAMSFVERRQYSRQPLAVGIRLWHDASGREFPARGVDASQGGLLMYVPVATPVQAGQTVRLTLGNVARPGLEYLSEQPIQATIARVDRHALLNLGYVSVGVKFAT